ncbi:hypothetical protein PWT90_07065 [Aphanocladium album]|nr:hypothetical protein PWT90_07065 [Aphanocladium album]
MAGSDKAHGLSPLVPVPWASIRNWLDQAEQMQAMTGGSTMHLPHVQLLALSRFANFVEEPPVPKEDSVSKLLRMSSAMLAAAAAPAAAAAATASTSSSTTPMDGIRFANGSDGPDLVQGKHLGVPTFEMGDPVDVPYRGAFQLRWHCVCVLPWCGERFPKMEAGEPAALFLNKKDAKQYAAALALDYLTGSTATATSHTPRETPQKTPQLPLQQLPQQISHPIQPPQPPQLPQLQQPPLQAAPNQPNTPIISGPATPPSVGNRPKRPLESPTARENTASPLKQRHVPPSPAAPATQGPAPVPLGSPTGKGEAAAEQNRLFNSIARLTARLGISQPQYKLTQDLNRPNFFSGRAEFSVASRVPDNIAVVQDVLGKKQARIQIAEQVLSWLENEEARRQAMVDELLSGL